MSLAQQYPGAQVPASPHSQFPLRPSQTFRGQAASGAPQFGSQGVSSNGRNPIGPAPVNRYQPLAQPPANEPNGRFLGIIEPREQDRPIRDFSGLTGINRYGNGTGYGDELDQRGRNSVVSQNQAGTQQQQQRRQPIARGTSASSSSSAILDAMPDGSLPPPSSPSDLLMFGLSTNPAFANQRSLQPAKLGQSNAVPYQLGADSQPPINLAPIPNGRGNSTAPPNLYGIPLNQEQLNHQRFLEHLHASQQQSNQPQLNTRPGGLPPRIAQGIRQTLAHNNLRDLPVPPPFNDPLRAIQTPFTTPIPVPGPNPVIRFDGRIDPLIPELELPIPQLDPVLGDWGNRDGEFELYDLIEEYSGRWSRRDLPDNPHLTPPEKRSWLRIEDWRTEVSWIVANANELGIGSASASVAFGIPKVKGLLIRPGGAIYWLNGPTLTDLPSQVYDAEVHGTWMHRFNDRFRAHVNVTGGVYSDFAQASVDGGFRLSGSGIGAFEVKPDLQLILGASYLNLGSIRMWPIGGLVWSPNETWRFELIYPEGRITVKIDENETYVEKHYLALGFWGRTWEVERTNGLREPVTYSDWRLTTGYERRYLWGITTFFEFGLAFNRDLEYRSGNGTFQPSSQLFARGGLFF